MGPRLAVKAVRNRGLGQYHLVPPPACAGLPSRPPSPRKPGVLGAQASSRAAPGLPPDTWGPPPALVRPGVWLGLVPCFRVFPKFELIFSPPDFKEELDDQVQSFSNVEK